MLQVSPTFECQLWIVWRYVKCGKDDAKLKEENKLQKCVEDNNFHRRSISKWSSVSNFPQLGETMLKLLTLGTYQLKLCPCYIPEYMGSKCTIDVTFRNIWALNAQSMCSEKLVVTVVSVFEAVIFHQRIIRSRFNMTQTIVKHGIAIARQGPVSSIHAMRYHSRSLIVYLRLRYVFKCVSSNISQLLVISFVWLAINTIKMTSTTGTCLSRATCHIWQKWQHSLKIEVSLGSRENLKSCWKAYNSTKKSCSESVPQIYRIRIKTGHGRISYKRELKFTWSYFSCSFHKVNHMFQTSVFSTFCVLPIWKDIVHWAKTLLLFYCLTFFMHTLPFNCIVVDFI